MTPPIWIEAPENPDKPLRLEISKFTQTLLEMLLNPIVGMCSDVLDKDLTHSLF